MSRAILVLLLTSSVAVAGEKWSAIDSGKWSAIDTSKTETGRHRVWVQPPAGPALVRETEAALDRGNGRIEDSYVFELRRVEAERALVRDAASGGNLANVQRARFELFQAELDRAVQIERARVRAAAQDQRVKVVEVESERLAGDRERWMKHLAKPRHAEAAVVEKQTEKGKQ